MGHIWDVMPYSVELPKRLKAEGWNLKIRDRERLEAPHVTIMCRTKEWRLGLRDVCFLIPPGGRWADLPQGVRHALIYDGAWDVLQREWDRRYPENPV